MMKTVSSLLITLFSSDILSMQASISALKRKKKLSGYLTFYQEKYHITHLTSLKGFFFSFFARKERMTLISSS